MILEEMFFKPQHSSKADKSGLLQNKQIQSVNMISTLFKYNSNT